MNRTLNINNINSIRNLLNKKAKILRTMPDDVDNQTATFNYTYDAIGNLIQDNTEGISAITWDVYGKIKMIDKGGSINDLYYGYDPMGNRIVKQDKLNKLISLKSGDNSKKTFYIRDASGNIMASYEVDVINYTEGQPLTTRVDYPMYGSSRVGEFHKQVTMSRINNAVWVGVAERYEYIVDAKDPAKLHILREYGAKQYELSNHLGNVLVTTSDLRKGTDNNADGKADYYNAIVTTANDYYAFGSLMGGRQYNSTEYKFGYNGQIKDDEIYGSGNALSFEYRVHDARLGRFLSVDPLTHIYVSLSTYCFAGNNPIFLIDVFGGGPQQPTPSQLEETIKVLEDFDILNGSFICACQYSKYFTPKHFWQYAHGYSTNIIIKNTGIGITAEAYLLNSFLEEIRLNSIHYYSSLLGIHPKPEVSAGQYSMYQFIKYMPLFNSKNSQFSNTWDFGIRIMYNPDFKGALPPLSFFAPSSLTKKYFADGTEDKQNYYPKELPKGEQVYLFESKALGDNLYTSSNIEKGFNQAIRTAKENKDVISVLVIDKQAYLSAIKSAKNLKLFKTKLSELESLGGHLMLVPNLKDFGESLFNQVVNEVKTNTSGQ